MMRAFAEKAEKDGAVLPLSEDITVLRPGLQIHGKTVANRLAIQPMEGCDGEADGAPGPLTIRRYHRFAKSGAAMIWFEAIAVVPEGRANPRQLMLTEANVNQFAALLADMRAMAGNDLFIVAQLTHSGRYSKPEGVPAPLIMYNNPLFEGNTPLPADRVVTDDYLAALPARYAAAARLAVKAGFDAVDLKACHRYLVNESLSAYTRPGRYGGDYAGRTRLMREAAEAIHAEVGGEIAIGSRMNLYDGFPMPYGFGVTPEGLALDMAEPIRLVTELRDAYDMRLWDFTMGNPYVNPHVNRPYDAGPYTPPEPPLCGLARMLDGTAQVKRAVEDIVVVSSGHTYPRQNAGYVAAGAVAEGVCDIAGFGRMAFAYPDFARDLLDNGTLEARKCCMACGKCSQLMRGSTAGCPVRDTEVYLPLYQRDVLGKAK